MALSFSVFNKFKAVDGVTAPVKKMEKSVGKFGKTTTKAFEKADRRASKFGKTVKGILVGGALLAGTAILTAGISKVTSEFVQFDDAIFAAGARFKDIGPDVDNFTESIKGIQAAARDAGATTEFTATQSAQALDFLARAGFKSAEAIGSLGSMINLATASGEDFSRVADISSDLLGAFGLNADNTAQKIKNLNRLNDVLIATVNSANVTIEDMFETMKQVGPVATGILGASLEEVAALTAVLGSSGIKGSEAMTALKNAYLRLAAPTSEARKLIDALNISMTDAVTGQPRKMTNLMEEIGEKISGLDRLKQAEVLDILFGKRAIAGAKNLADNVKNIRGMEARIRSLGGISQRTSDIIRQSLGNRLKTLNSAVIEFGFNILDSFKFKGAAGIDALTEAIRELNPQPFIEFIKIVGFALKGIKFLFDEFLLKIKDLAKLSVFVENLFHRIAAGIFGIDDAVISFGNTVAAAFSKIGQSIAGFGTGIGSKLLNALGFDQGAQTPISPNSGLINTVRQENNNRSTVDVNLNNVPAGSKVKQSGNSQGFNLNMGFSGAG